MNRLCFFAERQVGLGSVAEIVRKFAERRGDVVLTWVDVTYRPQSLLARLPLLPPSLQGPLSGFLQTGAGLRRGPHDVLVFMTHNPAVFRQRALRRTPTVLWTDVTPAQYDDFAREYEQPVSPVRAVASFKRAMVTRTFRLASTCLAWSEWARRSFVRDYGIPEDKTGVVAPGLDMQEWKPDQPTGVAAPRKPFKLLFVGGDFRRKGGPLLMDVFQRGLRATCELDLVTREEVVPTPGVRVHRSLTPGSPELRRLYREADAFILPTQAETFGFACLEAMASGLPVIATQLAALPEIVEEGRSGFLVPPRNGRLLAEAVETLAGNRPRAQAMGLRGRAIVEQRFDARTNTDALVNRALEAAQG